MVIFLNMRTSEDILKLNKYDKIFLAYLVKRLDLDLDIIFTPCSDLNFDVPHHKMANAPEMVLYLQVPSRLPHTLGGASFSESITT